MHITSLHAAADECNITPAPGVYLTGFASRVTPSVGIHDPLFVRALMLSDDTSTLLLITCDLIGFSPHHALAIRTLIAEKMALPLSAIMLSCTHTHSAPASMPFRGVMGIIDDDWLASITSAIVTLATGLQERMSPARIAWGRADVPNIGFNRQDSLRPADDMLRVLAIENHKGKRIATVVNYATHAVILGPSNLHISADFPGAVSRTVSARHGGISLYLQGACGDIDPMIYQERGWDTGTYDDCDEIAARITDGVERALKDAPRLSTLELATQMCAVALPLDPPPSAEERASLAHAFDAQRTAARVPPGNRVDELCADAMLQWLRELAHACDTHTLPRTLHIECVVWRIGSVFLCAAPLEIYSDIARTLEKNATPDDVMTVGYTNGLYGYLPSDWAKAQGGYGDDSCRWFPTLLTPLAKGADRLLTEACGRCIAALQAR